MNQRSQGGLFSSTSLARWIINLMLLPAASASGITHAQNSWQIDPSNSAATFSLGSGADTLLVGRARVSSQVVFQASNPTVASNPNSNVQRAEFGSMSFNSRRNAMTADGELIATGDLSVTRVERK